MGLEGLEAETHFEEVAWVEVVGVLGAVVAVVVVLVGVGDD